MAAYKVPQDVEAEDKLIGPFSFRQFIYLIIAALGILMGYLLARLFVGLAIIPLPVVALFLILALPLRKDQPMETYLVALVRFFLKPRRRLWQPDGAIGLVQITAPKLVEQQLTKTFGADEAAQRLNYLAQVVDTRGWSTRGVVNNTSPVTDDVVAEAQSIEDVLDENTNTARSFDSMIEQKDTSYKQSVMQQFQQAMRQPAQDDTPAPSGFNSQFSMSSYQPIEPDDNRRADNPAPALHQDNGFAPAFNPYPASMHQRVINPNGQVPQPVQAAPAPIQQQNQPAPSEPAVSPDIMRLASNNDLSISAIAREAHRLRDQDDGEVVISLR